MRKRPRVEAAIVIGFGYLGSRNTQHHGARYSVMVLVELPPCSTFKATTGAQESLPSTSGKQKNVLLIQLKAYFQ